MKSARSNAKTIILLAVLAAVAVGAYRYWENRNGRAPEFATVTVTRGDVTQTVTATGGLEAVTTVDVSSQVSGLIVEVAADFNTPVKAGQVLARIDPATYEQRLRQAEADLAAARAGNALTRINTERVRELSEKNLVSKQELDSAEAQLAQSNAQLLTREASVEDAKVNLARCTIYSPIDGIVLSRATDVGRTVAASLNAPTLFTIVDNLAKMRISAAVAEADIGSIVEGQTTMFTVDAFPNRQFRGRVSQVRNAPKTNQNVVSYDTIIDVANDDLKLKPGMTANVGIIVAQRTGALRLANSALRARVPDEVKMPAPAGKPEAAPEGGDGGERGGSGAPASMSSQPRTVYKLAGKAGSVRRALPISVKLGISDGIYTEVLEGLKEGDTLVTSVTMPAASSAPAQNPFQGGRRF